MESWHATGLLGKHWGNVGGRDKLAAKTGIQGTTLSAYNSGAQKLGIRNAKKIARALKVTIYDLGAPTEVQVAARSVPVVDRVAALEAEVALLAQGMEKGFAALRRQLRQQTQPPSLKPKPQRQKKRTG